MGVIDSHQLSSIQKILLSIVSQLTADVERPYRELVISCLLRVFRRQVW